MPVAEQLRLFPAQFEYIPHHPAVVPFSPSGAGLAGPGGKGAIHLLPQPAVLGMIHDRLVGRLLEGKAPAVHAGFAGGLPGRLPGVVGNPGKAGLPGDIDMPVVRGIQQVAGKQVAQTGQFTGILPEPFPLRGLEVDSGQPEIPQVIVDGLAPGLFETIEAVMVTDSLNGPVQGLVLAQFDPIVRQLDKTLLVYRTQVLAVPHRIQVGHRRPYALQFICQLLQRRHETVPSGVFHSVDQPPDLPAIPGQHPVHCRLHMLW